MYVRHHVERRQIGAFPLERRLAAPFTIILIAILIARDHQAERAGARCRAASRGHLFLFRQRWSQTSSVRLHALKALMSFMVRRPGGTCEAPCRHVICVCSQAVMQAINFADAPGPASLAAFCALAPAMDRIAVKQAITSNAVRRTDFVTFCLPYCSNSTDSHRGAARGRKPDVTQS